MPAAQFRQSQGKRCPIADLNGRGVFNQAGFRWRSLALLHYRPVGPAVSLDCDLGNTALLSRAVTGSEVVAHYRALGSLDRAKLDVLASWVTFLPRTRWADLLRSAGVKNGTRAVSPTDLGRDCERWMKLGLLRRVEREEYGLHPWVRHEVLSALQRKQRLRGLFEQVSAQWRSFSYGYSDTDRLQGALLGLYLGEHESVRRTLESYDTYLARSPWLSPGLLRIVTLDPHPELLALLPDDLAQIYLAQAVTQAVETFLPLGPAALGLSTRAGLGGETLALVAYYHLLRSEREQATRIQPGMASDPEAARALLAFEALSQGQAEAARAHAVQAFEYSRGPKKSRRPGIKSHWGPWLTLLLVTSPTSSDVLLALEVLESVERRRKLFVQPEVYRLLRVLLEGLRQAKPPLLGLAPRSGFGGHAPELHEGVWLSWLIEALSRHWGAADPTKELRAVLQALAQHGKAQGFAWVAAEFTALGQAQQGARQESFLARIYRARPVWETALDALAVAVAGALPASSEESSSMQRLAWVVTSATTPRFEARLQVSRGGKFSSGRALSPRQLVKALDAKAPWIADVDQPVLRTIVRERGFGGRDEYDFRPEAWMMLVGHPRVFSADNWEKSLRVVARPVRLQVKRTGDALRLSLYPAACAEHGVVVEQYSDDEVVVYQLERALREVARTLAAGLTVPAEGEARVSALLGDLSGRLEVSSDVAGTGMEEVSADSRIHVQLWRASSGVKARLRVLPFGSESQTFRPGIGQRVAVFEQQGKRLQTQRDLTEEAQNLEALLDACPSLASAERAHDDFVLSDMLSALELLSELGQVKDQVIVSWPDGQPLSVIGPSAQGGFKLRLASAGEWFSVDGELAVSDELRVSMADLLHDVANARGRFVPLDDDRFLALEQNVTRRLQQLARLSSERGKRVTVSVAQALVLEELAREFDKCSLSPEVARKFELIREARDLEPEVPRTFEAVLRDYQREGYAWLCRLAHWGGGACLADDMGLGKTLQALALLLQRAALGPQLVVAPMSVCQNWTEEARRFAPTLNLKRLATGKREAQLEQLGAFDVLVLSYGVMQNECERLGEVAFATVVLDEAQAIKNALSQRAKAAHRLRGEFRLVMTGTPIENRLSELWSLMEFANPGLLASKRQFGERFAQPIEKDGDKERSQLLRRVIAPFMLRRTKAQVLDELPSKTEIVLHVELEAEELGLYEMIRERALAQLAAGSAAGGNVGSQRLRLLAELMRLRRAACHPKLVAPDVTFEGAKFKAVKELLGQLREGGHRTLVFSQFVDHLDLVKAWLEAENCPYQYLTGSTGEKDRARAVNAFQRGEGDVFLISLKAGGFGLNLTSADYVVILDPWWNPASEDQAADRAHRIGQTRPVTVYRLVAKGTVEERIVALHQHKRGLAEQLLEGTSQASALDLEELRALLGDVHAARGAQPASDITKTAKTQAKRKGG